MDDIANIVRSPLIEAMRVQQAVDEKRCIILQYFPETRIHFDYYMDDNRSATFCSDIDEWQKLTGFEIKYFPTYTKGVAATALVFACSEECTLFNMKFNMVSFR